MAAAVGICMSQLIYKNQLRLSLKGCINIKFPEGNPVVWNTFTWKHFQTMQKSSCFWSCMRFDISGNHINSTLLCLMSRFQHSIGFSNSGSISKKYFQTSLGFISFFLLNRFQKFISHKIILTHKFSPLIIALV